MMVTYCRTVETSSDDTNVPLKWRCVSAVLLVTLALYIHIQQLEVTARLDFIWKSQVIPALRSSPIPRHTFQSLRTVFTRYYLFILCFASYFQKYIFETGTNLS